MKQTFTQKLTLSFCLILIAFSIGVIIFEHQKEKVYRTEALEERLDSYTEIAYQYIDKYSGESNMRLDTLLSILPANLRLTVIEINGNVLYDNRLYDYSTVENHANRPEIKLAKENGKGSNIRMSDSMQKKYLYYAKHLGNLYIRVALPYDIHVKHFLQPDNAFLYYLLVLLVAGTLFIRYIAGQFGRTITRLRDYSYAVNNQLSTDIPDFPNDETGELSKQIAEEYKRLKESETKLAIEHEKLLMHIQSSAEGVCFFTSDRKVAFYNGLFLQYLTMLSDNAVVDSDGILNDYVFQDILHFINSQTNKTYFEAPINKQGKHFTGRVNIFEDRSFEIVLNDNTKQEKNRLLKREMTGNIAHELRTPVTGIRGYLETILNNQLDQKKEHEFVAKAYEQILMLSDLIRDMSLLSKINEAPSAFRFKPFRLQDIIEKVKSDLDEPLRTKGITINSTIPPDFTIVGNESLIYSVFRNLIDNVISHAGENVAVNIHKYNQEGRFAYFSFSDNGVGIADDKHLNRLFERFYRVSEGRTRETGGSGLGLAIVKNAINFHGGTVSVKNRIHGGLEFLFQLPVE
ncbi:MAG: ATP-binding protein [Candidatus Azobacteroides sp.]|nr:ATP-binding protein [Candidatus Azobacteroides sp.]